MLLSLGLRWFYWDLNPLMSRDAAMYCHIAVTWSRTGDFNIAFSEHIGNTAPFFIYLLKFGVDLGIPVIRWGHFLAFAFSGAFVFAFYLLGKELFDGRRDAGLICLLIAGTHPVIGRVSVDILREGPFFMFAAFAMVYFVRAFKTRAPAPACICGMLLGAASMSRHEGLELLFLAAVALLPWRLPREKRFSFRNWLPPSVMIAGALAAFLLLSALCGIPMKHMAGKYLSRLDKITIEHK